MPFFIGNKENTHFKWGICSIGVISLEQKYELCSQDVWLVVLYLLCVSS
jgi:hypothetical protein